MLEDPKSFFVKMVQWSTQSMDGDGVYFQSQLVAIASVAEGRGAASNYVFLPRSLSQSRSILDLQATVGVYISQHE